MFYEHNHKSLQSIHKVVLWTWGLGMLRWWEWSYCIRFYLTTFLWPTAVPWAECIPWLRHFLILMEINDCQWLWISMVWQSGELERCFLKQELQALSIQPHKDSLLTEHTAKFHHRRGHYKRNPMQATYNTYTQHRQAEDLNQMGPQVAQ